MFLGPHDLALLSRAVELAHQSIGLSDPNPRVGCVIHTVDGRLAGEGFTQEPGGPHAEVMALRTASAAGTEIRGGTVWVSLEPCAHHGRTPPCCDALIAAGVARVVVAMTDPFPKVAGQGIERLRAAGIHVDLAYPDEAPAVAARELNIGYLSRVIRHRPWVRLKIAASLDGRTALPNGESQWITGPEARTDGHRWRKRAGAILTGIGTVLRDDPRLDVRLVETTVQPRRVLVDSRLAVPLDARILQLPGQVTVVHASGAQERAEALTVLGVPVLALPGPGGQVDLAATLAMLAEQGVNELHVEAGAILNAALLSGDLVDELLVYLAPKLIGPGLELAKLSPLPSLSSALTFVFSDLDLIGDDVRLVARRVALDSFI